MKNKSLIFIFTLITTIALLHVSATNLFWYWKFWWFDIMMHFLGGLWVGLMSLWLYYFSGFNSHPRKEKKFVFLFSIISVLTIGIGWEVFEVLIQSNLSNGYWVDTTQDLIMDTLGALTAGFLCLKSNHKQQTEEGIFPKNNEEE